MNNNRITVFTPTYNRADTLKRLYESLCNQTFDRFVWLVIDDGSNDKTSVLFDEWKRENKINIKYYKQTNKGKMIAHNLAVNLTETAFFVCLDSDDYFCDHAIEIIEKDIELINGNDKLIGIIYPRNTSSKIIKCDTNKCKESTLHGLYADGLLGETTILFKTKLLQEYPFVVEENEKFVPEAIAYDLIDQKYKYLYHNVNIVMSSYMQDGYSKNIIKTHQENPCGLVRYYYQSAELWNIESCKSISYKYTFLIKDKRKRKKYRMNHYKLHNKIVGFLMYIKFQIKVYMVGKI